MLQQLLKGRLLGHPVHPMLVHFPTALFLSSFVLDCTGCIAGNSELITFSTYCMGGGLAGGAGAALFGLIDYLKLTGRRYVFRTASWHAGLQITVFMMFGVLFGIRIRSFAETALPAAGELVISGAAVLMMLAGNYLGGELVFRHKVGIEK